MAAAAPRRGRETPAALFLAPALAVLALVALFPALGVVWLSLQRRGGGGATEFAGLANYARLVGDDRFWNAFGNTLYFAVVSVAAELVLGLAIALLLARLRRGVAIVYSIVLVPWAVPTVVSARMWEWMYNAHYGVINYLLGLQINWLGGTGVAMHAAIVMDVWKSTPFVAVLLLAARLGIAPELYHAAALDGAGGWTVFRRITLPLLLPVIAVTLAFRTIDAFRVFDAIYVLTGGGPANSTESLSIYAYKLLFQSLDAGYGSAVSVVVLLCVGLATLGYTRLLRSSL